MKTLFIVPGSGDSFYCGNCFRDNLMAQSLKKYGNEVIIIPLYLPLMQKTFRADSPLFFPATTYYAAHKFFRHANMPRWLEKLMNAKPMLRMASKMSGATSAKGMENMTLSMIEGDDRHFQKHFGQMLEWIRTQEKPDVIHLSSSMLIGFAKVLRENIDVPVICSLQDEEVWINSLDARYAQAAWDGIAKNSCHIDAFVCSSEYYRDIAVAKIPSGKVVEVIYPGIDKSRYKAEIAPADNVIGFFYRMNRENGLDILANAFVLLKQKNAVPNLRLKIGGGFSGSDRKFLKHIRKILAPYIADVDISETYSYEEHEAFYRSISVISVPVTFDEGVGLYLCESFAAGRPAVEPATGSIPEIVGKAGLTYSPNTPEHLAAALEKILSDRPLYERCAAHAVTLSDTRYSQQTMAADLIKLYWKCLTPS
jgi:glycosyltransferase involved in cell wall biosynthesis